MTEKEGILLFRNQNTINIDYPYKSFWWQKLIPTDKVPSTKLFLRPSHKPIVSGSQAWTWILVVFYQAIPPRV